MTNVFNRKNCTRPTIRKDQEVPIGFEFEFDIFVFADDSHTAPYDVTNILGMDAIIQDDPVSPTTTIEKSLGVGVMVVDAPNGQLRVRLDPEDTLMFGPYGGRLYYEVSLTDDNSDQFLVASGTLLLSS